MVKLNFSPKDIEEFLNIIELSGISNGHKKEVKRAIENNRNETYGDVLEKEVDQFDKELDEYAKGYY